MAERRDEYLAHAEECERLAASASLESTRAAMLASAILWRKLAAAETGKDDETTAG